MTCIVGYRVAPKNGEVRVLVGSDRGLYTDDTVKISPHPKIFARTLNFGKDSFIIGADGSCRFGDQLEHLNFNGITISATDRKNPTKFLKKKLVPYIKAKIPNTEESNMIIAIMDQIFEVDEEYSVIVPPDYGAAIGAGAEAARGSLYTSYHMVKTYRKKIDPVEVIHMSLEAAENVSLFCRAPYDILEL